MLYVKQRGYASYVAWKQHRSREAPFINGRGVHTIALLLERRIRWWIRKVVAPYNCIVDPFFPSHVAPFPICLRKKKKVMDYSIYIFLLFFQI